MTSVLKLDQIHDGGAQMRVEMSDQTIIDYVEELVNGTTFPPVVVYFDGSDHWLADGYHRVEAARKIGRDTIDAEIRNGTQRDAILVGIGANAAHGLRRTQADKRRAVETLLRDDEWSKLSDRQIAKQAKVDHKTVGKIRRDLMGGEFPSDGGSRETGTPSPAARPTGKTTGSVAADFLKAIGDSALIDECQRRGFRVEAPDAD